MPSRQYRHSAADCPGDIIDNAETIQGYVADLDQASFEANGLIRDAVERCVERVCEAVFRLADRADALMPGHPWGDVRGMGNRLRHAYDRVAADIIWNTARQRVPALAADARRALARLEAGGG